MLLLKRIMLKVFFHDFLLFSISAYQILTYHFDRILGQKNTFFLHFSNFWSYFQIWVSYMHIIAHEHSYDIIGQKSSIGQKFLLSCAPLKEQKTQQNLYKFAMFSLIFLSFTKCCRFEARGVTEISVWSTIFGLCC